MVVFAADPNAPQLPRFYANREIFITGATGFMGKVLVERLLSTCPDVGRLFLLVRDKKGQHPEERLAQLKQSPVFHNIRLQDPSQLDKLVAVPGDTTEAQLGLDVNAIAALKEVSVVFHNAATTKFTEPLRDAVSQNILSAIHVMDICDKLPELEALVHVSTAFTNMDLPHIEERVCDMPVNLQQLLELLDTHTSEELEEMTPRLIQPKPNTYIFAKALAEIAVAQRQHRDYSVTIFRPSIVVSAHQAPFPGWVEGYSGLTGIVITSGLGVLRVTQYRADYRIDYVPVDVAIDNMIAVGWETAMERPVAARVYYCGSQENPVLWREAHAEIRRWGVLHPMDNVLYYPFSFAFSNRYIYKAFELLLQTLPLHLAAYVSKMCGIKQPICLKTVAKRLSAMTALMSHFTCNQWTFSCDNMRRLREKLHKTDGHLFYLDIRDINWMEHTAKYQRGAREFVLKQKDETLPRAKERMNRLRLIHYVVQLVLMLLGYKLFKSLIPKIYQLGNRLLLLSIWLTGPAQSTTMLICSKRASNLSRVTPLAAMVVFAADPNAPQLPRFYANREIFITGATGFMGKVLVERLLSTCPDVGRLFLLVRDKKGQHPEERLAQLKQSPVFHNIRLQDPSQLDKLVAVPGDTTEAQLGLDVNAIAALKEVSVVFHNAATTKFTEPLRDAVSQNILSAIHVMDICDKLPELEALVHVSTAFTNMDLPHIEERVCDMPVNLQQLLELLDTHTSEELEEMTPRLIQPKPNTYIFAKALAEIAVAQRQHRDYSVTIFRPSIVVSAHQAPFPGWVEGYSGLTGIVITSGLGVLRVTQYRADYRIDYVPVDVAIDNMIAVGWETAMERPVAARVYYCGSQENPVLWREAHAEIRRWGVLHPMDNVLYYPFSFAFSNRYIYKAFELLLQTLPLHLAAYVSKLCGIKQPICLKTVAERLSAMTALMSHFTCNQWTFSCDNMRRLREKLHKTDGHLFYLDIRDINWMEHTAKYQRGAREFVLKQKDETLPRAKERMNRLRLIHYVVQLVLMLLGYKLFKSLIPKIYQLGNRLLLLSMLRHNSRLKTTQTL